MKKDPVCNMDVREEKGIVYDCDGITYYFCSEGCREKFVQVHECKLLKTAYDLIIVGGGPAGLTAAVYAATLKINAFLIAKDIGGQAVDSTRVDNYMGFDFITGPELIEKFQYQLIHSHHIDHLLTEVEKIEPVKAGFTVITSELKKYFAKTLLIATGMTRRRLNVAGESEFQRKGLFYGNIQDLSFVHGEDVAVVGGGNSAFQIVENLHTIAKNIYLVSDSPCSADAALLERVRQFKNLKTYEEFKVLRFSGDDTVKGITIRRKAGEEILEIPVRGIFIAIGLQPNSSLVSQFVELNERKEIVVSSDCSTTHTGIFAAGDVTNAFGKRIIIASGEGAKAALAARQYLLNIRREETVKD